MVASVEEIQIITFVKNQISKEDALKTWKRDFLTDFFFAGLRAPIKNWCQRRSFERSKQYQFIINNPWKCYFCPCRWEKYSYTIQKLETYSPFAGLLRWKLKNCYGRDLYFVYLLSGLIFSVINDSLQGLKYFPM